MKKILCLVLSLLIVLSFSACNTKNEDNANSSSVADEIVIKQPTDNSVNGYRVNDSQNESVPDFTDTQSTPKENTVTLYYANTNTKKFHLKSCGSASTISNENLYICEDRQELIDSGYSPCARCKP